MTAIAVASEASRSRWDRFDVLWIIAAQSLSMAWFTQSNSYAQAPTTDCLQFHCDAQRTGWQQHETVLAPNNVTTSAFGWLWNSPQFDLVNGKLPHAYATPLYKKSVIMTGGSFPGRAFDSVFVALSNGSVYAVNARTTTDGSPVAAGTVLWRTRLCNPGSNNNLDAVEVGILSTPVIDAALSPARLYSTCADATLGWQIFALDLTSGKPLSGWPLTFGNSDLAGINQNGPATFQQAGVMSQRGALNLSADGKVLYIPFGGYVDSAAGWLVAVNTGSPPALASAFSGAPSYVAAANAGMWASGGVALDSSGSVYSTTGNGSVGNETTPGFWGNSLLSWKAGLPLTLRGTYTPFNYCPMELNDLDLAGGGAIAIPSIASTGTSTPNLLTFGGKQGNVYLLDRDHLRGGLKVRQGCGNDASLDTSLLPPGIQPQFGTRGPLNVFGPYSETFGNADYAKARTTPAYFKAGDGTNYVFVSGSNKSKVDSQMSVPPGLCRLRIVTSSGQPAYLAIDACETTLALLTPGSPMVTSYGSANAIVWELVANITRQQQLDGLSKPFFFALDPLSMRVLWKSQPGQLKEGGKYNTVTVADGLVFVATDRVQTFGLLSGTSSSSPGSVAINVCGPSVGIFVEDMGASGGHCDNTAVAISTNGVAGAAPYAIYQTKRSGNSNGPFSYTITALVPNQTYTVKLHFGDDVSTAAGQRRFNVVINGVQVLANFDVFATAGKYTAVVRQFTASSDGFGSIKVDLSPAIGNPLLNGIEVIPSSLSINACGPAVGNFIADTGFTGGHCDNVRNVISTTGVADAAPAAIYQSKRTGDNGGSFKYTISALTASRTYAVKLHFGDDVSTAAGQRKFNVLINGVQVLTGFDIFAAGGLYHAVVRQFAVSATPAGSIIVTLTSAVGNPLLSGIETIP